MLEAGVDHIDPGDRGDVCQLRAISEERAPVSLQRRPHDEQSGAEALSQVEARANQEVQQLQAALRTERSAYLASENQLGATAQTAQADRTLLGQEQMAAASVLRERAQRFEATLGAQAEIAVYHARSKATAQAESLRQAMRDEATVMAAAAYSTAGRACAIEGDKPRIPGSTTAQKDEVPHCRECDRCRVRE